LSVVMTWFVLAMGTVVLGARGLDAFGALHLTYLGLTVTVPLLGAALLTRTLSAPLLARLEPTLPPPPPPTAAERILGTRKAEAPRPAGPLARRVAIALGVVLLLPAPVGWYATHVAPHRLRVDRVAVPVDPARTGDDPVRIGVLTDLQTDDPGSYEHDAVDRLLAEEPDLVLLPGDLFQGSRQALDRHLDDMRALLGRITAPHGVYLVRGDVDWFDAADRLVEGTGITILDDEAVDVTVGDRRLRIGGHRLAYRTPEAAALRDELHTAPEDGTIRILLAHRPDAALHLPPDSRVDLVVAGHTHGGQIAVPGFGPLVTMSDVPRDVAAGGLHELAGNPIYVGTGVGLERGQAPQVRLFTRPSVGILHIASEKPHMSA
ncbi:MAG TPA: metallophosphoesterase, partial [Acidimicrobiales bacterium]